MGGKPLSIVDPARVRVVFVPVGRVRHARFMSFLERFEHEDVVQLRDVSPDNRPHTTLFSPLAFPNGRVLFDIGTSIPPTAHLALSPFEIYRQPFVVVAVADGKEPQPSLGIYGQNPKEANNNESENTLSKDSIDSLLQYRDQLASDFSMALVHQVLVFDCDVANQRLPDGIASVLSPAKSKTTTIKTVMCDLTSQLLAEMTSLARSLQELASIESPKAPRQSIQRPLARYFDTSRPASADPNLQTNDAQRSDHRMSMPAHLLTNLGSRSSTPEGRPASPSSGAQTAPINVNGTTSSPSSPPSRPTDVPRPMSRDRASLQGFGSNSLSERERAKQRGRISIVMGSLYMLAGRWPDAVKEISDGAAVAKANNDHMWHGKGLDYLLVVCLLYAWADFDFRIPPLLHAATEKTGASSVKSSKDTPASSHADLKGTSTTPSRDASLTNLFGLLPELVTSIQNLYSRAWTFSEDKLPQLSFSDSGLRFAKLLTFIENSKGKQTDVIMKQIAVNMPSQPDIAQAATLTNLPSKAELTTFLFRSFPSPGIDDSLTVADRTRILAEIASILAELGYHRKKSFVLKELLEGLVPALVEARKRGAADMGVHPAASLASLDAALFGVRDTRLYVPYGESETGIQNFLDSVCSAYGVNITTGPNTSSKDIGTPGDAPEGDQTAATVLSDSTEVIIQRAFSQASSRYFGSSELKTDILRLCISVCEALPDLEGVLRFSVELLRTSGSGIAPGPEDNNGSPSLSIDGQLRLWNNISRTVGAARQLGVKHFAAEYWDEFLVRGIEIVPSTSNIPRPHAIDDLESVNKSGENTNSGPFLYNPFGQSGPAKTAKPVLAAGEEAEIRVTLQNLYDFDLEIESIKLVLNNDGHSIAAQGLVIGPYRTQSIFLNARWPKNGSTSIPGCIAKIRGCRQRWFPLFNEPWAPKIDIKTMQSTHTELQSENRPHDRDFQQRKGMRTPGRPVPSSLDLEVIPALPNIVLKRMSLSQSAIMLLEGEKKTFKMTLCNASESVTADLILLTFKDSTEAQLRAAMANKELPPSGLHELELAAAKSSLRWLREDNDEPLTISPGGEVTFKIEVAGKPGLSDASILVSYAHLGVPRSHLKGQFYTRQLSIPLTITVNASIDLVRADLLPFTPAFAWQNQQRQTSYPSPPSSAKSNVSTKARRPASMSMRSKSSKTINNENRFQALLSRIGLSPNDKSHCLLCLNCRNSWPTPLSISVQVRSPSTTTNSPQSPASTSTTSNPSTNTKISYTVHESLQPGHTKRILLLLPRIRLPHPHLPIPTPSSKKQFVVTAAPKQSYEAQLAAREHFWYREELLKQIHATWTEESTGRTGLVNLRGMRLKRGMVAVLGLGELEVEMALSLFTSDGSASEIGGVEQTSPSKYLVPLSTPLTLITTLTNHSPHPIHPLLRLQPRLADLTTQPGHLEAEQNQKLLIHGLLQHVLPVLVPGASAKVEVGVTVLGRGKWVLGGVVEEVRAFDYEEVDGDDGLMRNGKEERERRVWAVDGVVVVGRG
ncbi:MAG: hypothetical protein Q9170_005689 [Blastenia crenularia]